MQEKPNRAKVYRGLDSIQHTNLSRDFTGQVLMGPTIYQLSRQPHMAPRHHLICTGHVFCSPSSNRHLDHGDNFSRYSFSQRSFIDHRHHTKY